MTKSPHNCKTSYMVTTISRQNSSATSVEQAARGFAALGSSARLAVLRILVRTGEDGLTIGMLQQRSGIAASTLAHHLRTLSNCGLVVQSKNGREVITRPDFAQVGALSHFLVCECCGDIDSEIEIVGQASDSELTP